ncbi:adenylate/guanylate cyclase domain-containing protein [Actinocorallia sp. A-T 12471]|uniref:adenylate/guanylate cyclase domain-containing protein n=1 Tax=Actinocorallia sp. A-T 12471 TaxID=3089813 RepID=UPI0029CCD9FE|nr:adenylate/guanylate cyclase domain-containing protein [Actinocorallia sp. A-T 12471]MDX6743841.1 adenylate/guanylate cyclase domain-containing protein [Actinocorallia sp. A-T 12471]
MGRVGRVLARVLDGPPTASRERIEARTRRLVLSSVVVANIGGALVVLALAIVVLPDPADLADAAALRAFNTALLLAYLTVAIVVGAVWGLRLFRPMRRLFLTGRRLADDERRLMLRAPLRMMRVHVVLWGLASVGWAAVNLWFSPLMALKVGLTCLLGGLTTSTIIYLLTERLFRRFVTDALSTRVPEESGVPGVVARLVLAWTLGTAIPVLGLLIFGAVTLLGVDVTAAELAWVALALGGTALVVGVAVTYLVAQAVAAPIDSVRQAIAEVERGGLDVEVPVYDGSQIGQLQAGFNHMVAGLRERELIQDLFGRQVGEDVARLTLEHGVELGGELRDVCVIFVDLVGSTRLAATRPPIEVVTLLNEFFAVVVDVVERHGGWINKFEGDAALAVFGAPSPLDNAPTRTLAAARTMAARLAAEVPGVTAAVGVSGGEVVAGHIGAVHRFEYTVIGDPVNEAARLTELAKKTPGLLMAAGTVLDAADPGEAAHWEISGEVTVRGRTRPTRTATLRAAED